MRTIPELQEGTHRAKASGTLPNGKPVVVNADGTVSVVAETDVSQSVGTPVQFSSSQDDWLSCTYDANAQKVVIVFMDDDNSNYGTAIVGTVSGTSISFGTQVVFESGSTKYTSCAYDANAQKVVIAYSDSGNLSYGTAVVGTVSGTSISFGTPVTFNSSSSTFYTSCAYDASAQKVVISYRGVGSDGFAIVGTVSGTSITFGSAVEFETGNTNYTSAVYDASSQKIVIAYQDAGTSGYGTAIVGTVSGTSISFGSLVVFNAGNTVDISTAYDANSQKVVISFSNDGNSLYGTAVVGTVSGTSISFGTAVVFSSSNSRFTSASYDSNAQKVLISYQDVGNLSYPTAVAGTVSGTSISFGSPVVLDASGAVNHVPSVYDEASEKIVIAYTDNPNNIGEAVVFQNASTSKNLTSENYIGMSQGGSVADGSSATVDIIGSLSTNQSGLTAGQQYYVQTDGTIGETAADPSVFAGTAISATSLVVKT